MAGKIKPQRRRDTEERTCVYCGCSESRACKGGCCWIERHPATPTGVCSNCGPQQVEVLKQNYQFLIAVAVADKNQTQPKQK